MGLAEVQLVLAQLYTNTELRERFFANPQVVGEELGLSVDEQQQLALLSAQQVKGFASSLKRKRLGEVRELLPLTARVLGKDCSKLFWQYAETYVPQGIKKHWEDALAFASFVQNVEEIEPSWIVDLVRYEEAWLQASVPNCRFQVCWFNYNISWLVRSLTDNWRTPRAIYQPTIAIWFRLTPKGKLRHKVLSLFTSFNAPN